VTGHSSEKFYITKLSRGRGGICLTPLLGFSSVKDIWLSKGFSTHTDEIDPFTDRRPNKVSYYLLLEDLLKGGED